MTAKNKGLSFLIIDNLFNNSGKGLKIIWWSGTAGLTRSIRNEKLRPKTDTNNIKLNWENSDFRWIEVGQLKEFNTVPSLERILLSLL